MWRLYRLNTQTMIPRVFFLLLLLANVISASPVQVVSASTDFNRIVGGEVTSINSYPYVVSMVYNQGYLPTWDHYCAATVLTTTALLSCAHCYDEQGENHSPNWWRARVGSTYANSGGSVHLLQRVEYNPGYNYFTYKDDLAIIRLSSGITYIPSVVERASIAGSNYILSDNTLVNVVGWGYTSTFAGASSEELREVTVNVINHNVCQNRYSAVNPVTFDMFCTGILDVGDRDHCTRDSGGPVIHNEAIVGVISWQTFYCGDPYYPSVNMKVSSYTDWIVNTAEQPTIINNFFDYLISLIK